jgi:acyl-coenzyme A synthetase/AMP-(fatty) acid ligase
MKTPLPKPLEAISLRHASRFQRGDAALMAPDISVSFSALARGNPLSVPPARLRGSHVLIRTTSQLAAALALVALDGFASRLVIAPPDLKEEYLADVIARAGLNTLVTDTLGMSVAGLTTVSVSPRFSQLDEDPAETIPTEWVLFTSGTTGAPKMVAHSLAGLTGAIGPRTDKENIVWGTFYDIRRYGGLQILLRAWLGRVSLVLSQPDEPVADFLARLGEAGVTHLTGTPSHWRRALMSPAIAKIAPRYVRLSGEIADQPVLDALKARFPTAAMGHAYAATEAGVGFEVTDGLEGFPASFVGRPGPVEMRVTDGALQIRSARTASDYVGGSEPLKQDGWVDSGDLIEQRGERFYFAGRRGGVINVGGLKINPEEVEAVINRHPRVALSRVSARKNPITGAIVVADVVLKETANDNASFKEELLALCREKLPSFKVPAMLRFVERLELTAGGKLSRHA